MNVLVVGGSSSLGRAILSELGSRGHQALVTYCREPTPFHSSRRAARLDLQSPSFFDGFCREHLHVVENDHGFVPDAVVFAAGALVGKSLPEYDAADVERVLAVNFSGPALFLQALQRHSGVEHALFVSSLSARRGSFDPIYAASKGAVESLVKSLSRVRPLKTRVNAVSPGLVEGSGMAGQMTDGDLQRHLAETPTGKLVDLGDLAGVVCDLLSPRWKSLNGAVVALDGGR